MTDMGLLTRMRERAAARRAVPASPAARPETGSEESQCRRILDHMLEGYPITQAMAVELYGCYRLSARIWDLRHRQKWGAPVIKDEMESDPRTGSRFKRYWIEP